MTGPVELEELERRGSDRPASAPLRDPYRAAFDRYGVLALWSSRPVEAPTAADLLAITESLRAEGGVAGRRLAEQIVAACRAAL